MTNMDAISSMTQPEFIIFVNKQDRQSLRKTRFELNLRLKSLEKKQSRLKKKFRADDDDVQSLIRYKSLQSTISGFDQYLKIMSARITLLENEDWKKISFDSKHEISTFKTNMPFYSQDDLLNCYKDLKETQSECISLINENSFQNEYSHSEKGNMSNISPVAEIFKLEMRLVFTDVCLDILEDYFFDNKTHQLLSLPFDMRIKIDDLLQTIAQLSSQHDSIPELQIIKQDMMDLLNFNDTKMDGINYSLEKNQSDGNKQKLKNELIELEHHRTQILIALTELKLVLLCHGMTEMKKKPSFSFKGDNGLTTFSKSGKENTPLETSPRSIDKLISPR